MPYNPGISYRGDAYLAAGFDSLTDQMTSALDRYTEAGKKAKAMRQTLKLYAPSLGDEGKAVAAGVDAMSLPELEGAFAGLAQYAAQTQANERQKLAADEEKRRAAHDEALRAYYDEGRQIQRQQQDRLDQAARTAADWQAQMGDYADAYGNDQDTIRAAIAYANRVAPGGMPREVAADLLSGTAAKPQWTPTVIERDGVRFAMISPNSAQVVPPEGTPGPGISATDRRIQITALNNQIRQLEQKRMMASAEERVVIDRQIEDLTARMQQAAGLTPALDQTPLLLRDSGPVVKGPARKYKIEVVP